MLPLKKQRAQCHSPLSRTAVTDKNYEHSTNNNTGGHAAYKSEREKERCVDAHSPWTSILVYARGPIIDSASNTVAPLTFIAGIHSFVDCSLGILERSSPAPVDVM
jgi:hypothetical protein